jgi:protein-L-isoaspartate(D-aspartate) O-methyltransferase
MADELITQRQTLAGNVQAACNIQTPLLVDALRSVPREQFLPPGPWQIRGVSDFGGSRQTPDADPRHVYQDASVAIDPARQLFSGAPSAVAPCIDALGLRPGDSVLHVGCGLGYYSAVMAHCVGPNGRLVAIEIDEALAADARTNLAPWNRVSVLCGNGVEAAVDSYDAILVSAGMTHPHQAWLDGLRPGGRLAFPLTFRMELMGTLGKGVVTLITRTASADIFDARIIMMAMIYSAEEIRNPLLEDRVRDAFMRGRWPAFSRLRRDQHEPSSTCWYHGDSFCFAAG